MIYTFQEKNRNRLSQQSGIQRRSGYTRSATMPKKMRSPNGFRMIAQCHGSTEGE